MALDYNPDREGHVDHKYIVMNATKQPKKYIEASGRKMELSKEGWLIVHNKPKFTGISLNTHFKKEIIEFIETNMPHLKGSIR